MIEKIISYSRVTEVDTVTSQIIAAYTSSSLSSDINLSNIFNQLQPLSDQMNLAINRSKTESELEEKDELRDDAVRSLYYLILGFTHHPNKKVKEAANKVMEVVDNYGLSIVSESYATESSLINSLLTQLKTMEDTVSVLSGAAESIALLESKQESFEASHLSYEQNKATEGTYKNATAIKKDILKLVNGKLLVYLNAMGIVEEATYGKLAGTVAQIIADNNEVVKKRSTKQSLPLG